MPTATDTVGRSRSDSDPLSRALQAGFQAESADERSRRIQSEAEAKKISDAIDEQLKAEMKARAKKRKEVKVLLLGQSESGKSTTLKQFQLLYSPNAFAQEAPAWRPIVYLNLVRSIRRILEALAFTEVEDDVPTSPVRPGTANSSRFNAADNGADLLTGEYAELRQRLAPLLDLEERLISILAPPEEDEATQLTPLNNNDNFPTITGPKIDPRKEVAIRNGGASGGWKKALSKFSNSNSNSGKSKSPNGSGYASPTHDAPAGEGWAADPDDPVHVLARCRQDMIRLWQDPRVQAVLRRRRLRLEESSGFYLNDINRVTGFSYLPSVDDVLRARLKTLGVIEHRFTLEKGQEKGVDWLIYDVGGARNQRQAWAPFFDDVNALIFLAPISAFDQVLTEDPDVNRVEDSLLLWRSVVSNKLLSKVNIVLFLNKCDLLREKLDAGVRLARYMTSYADRPNDYDSVSRYFRSKFGALHKSYSPNQDRDFYVHMTSVTDIETTAAIIVNVRDMILKNALRESALI